MTFLVITILKQVMPLTNISNTRNAAGIMCDSIVRVHSIPCFGRVKKIGNQLICQSLRSIIMTAGIILSVVDTHKSTSITASIKKDRLISLAPD